MRFYRARPAITITSSFPVPYPPAETGPSHSKSHPALSVRLLHCSNIWTVDIHVVCAFWTMGVLEAIWTVDVGYR